MEGKAAAEIDDAISSSHDVPKQTSLDRELFDQKESQVLNQPEHTGRFNFTTQFPYYREGFCKPDLKGKNFEKNLVFDMDMSAGDFLAFFYLLKLPVEDINLKVDCDEHKSVCGKHEVQGYPTIQWFPEGSLEPKKSRSAEALAEFVNSEAGMV